MPKNIPFFLPFPSVPFGLHAQEVSSQLGDVFYGKNTSKGYLLGVRFFPYFLTSSIYASYDQYWKKKSRFFSTFPFQVIQRTYPICLDIVDAEVPEKLKFIWALLFLPKRSQKRHAVFRRSQRVN